jgi:hypothetical protein
VAGLKRKVRRTLPRRGIVITQKVDRGQQILNDPATYFSQARQKAKQQVERDMERERRLLQT